ncbi:calcium-binding protein [Rhodovibrionaceae bacterium A322]
MATILGGEGSDTLSGGNENDTIKGFAADDKLSGNAGNDLVFGGADNDFLEGGSDNDTLRGGKGLDILNGDDNNDRLLGDLGHDKMFGGAGDDTLFGGFAVDENGDDDTLSGGDGNDVFEMGTGQDQLFGGQGNDLFKTNNSVTGTVNAGFGNDTMTFTGNRADYTIEKRESCPPELGGADPDKVQPDTTCNCDQIYILYNGADGSLSLEVEQVETLQFADGTVTLRTIDQNNSENCDYSLDLMG